MIRFWEFCKEYKHSHELDCSTANEDVIACWLVWLVDKFNASPSTLTTYLSALKRSIVNGDVQGDINTTNTQRIKDILQGTARTHEKSTSRSISAAFSMDHFNRLLALYDATPRGERKDYNDTLTLAIMAMGLGGCLRPSEYLITTVYQPKEAVLTFSAVTLFGRHRGSGTRPVPVPSLQFVERHRTQPLRSLQVDHISITLKRSKTDQTSYGRTVVINEPICIRRIMAYLIVCPRNQDPSTPFFLFSDMLSVTSMQAVNQIRGLMRSCSFCASDDFVSPDDFTMKSLRSGAVHTLLDNNADGPTVMARGGWTNLQTPLRHYHRTAPSSASPSQVTHYVLAPPPKRMTSSALPSPSSQTVAPKHSSLPGLARPI